MREIFLTEIGKEDSIDGTRDRHGLKGRQVRRRSGDLARRPRPSLHAELRKTLDRRPTLLTRLVTSVQKRFVGSLAGASDIGCPVRN